MNTAIQPLAPEPTRSTKGFTIVELLIVIVVIAILAAITIVAYNGIQERARASSASQAASQASKKVKVWQVDREGQSPTCTEFFELLNNSTTGAPTGSCSFDYSGVGYQYTASGTGDYCVTTTVGTASFWIDQANPPKTGGCGGHGQGGVAAITNLAPNPSVEFNATGWGQNWGTSGAGTVTRPTDGGRFGAAYYRMTWSTAPTVTWGGINFPSIPVTEGQSLTASVWVRSQAPRAMRLALRPNNHPTNPDSPSTSTNVPSNTWTLLSATLNSVPAGVTSYSPFTARQGAGAWAPGDILDHDGLMVTQGTTVHNFADGESPNWIWNGIRHNSTSTGLPQ